MDANELGPNGGDSPVLFASVLVGTVDDVRICSSIIEPYVPALTTDLRPTVETARVDRREAADLTVTTLSGPPTAWESIHLTHSPVVAATISEGPRPRAVRTEEPTVPERARRWIDRVEAWANAQEIEHSSQQCYAEHLRRFPQYFAQLGFPGIYSAGAVTREAVLAFKFEGKGYRGKNRGKELAVTTRAMDLGLLRAFLGFEKSNLALDAKLFRFRPGQVRPERIRRMDSPEEIRAVLNAAPSEAARAVFALGLYGGLRPAEARAVTVADVELTFTGQSSVRVRKGKWGKPRQVKLPRHARNLILAAIVGKGPTERVYPHCRAKHATDLDRACRAAGTRHYSPHDLRRTYAAMMFSAGAPLEAVQDQLGHEDPATTRHYQGPVRVDGAIEQLERYLGA